jgi:hypothetical protein
MAGTTSKISMISNALILLGDAPISSLNDPGAGAIAAANLYESGYVNLLSLHRWRFATKQAQLPRLTASPLRDDYKYQFQLPSDFIYLHNTSVFRDYEIFEDKLYANNQEVLIDYTYRVNEDKLPYYFVMTMQFFLASIFAIPVTANSTRSEAYRLQYEAQLKRAKFLDASQRPNEPIQHRPYIEIRN